MPIPRFIDEKGNPYDVALSCKCGYAIPRDKITKDWDICPLCGGKLRSVRVDYPKTKPEER